MNHEPISQICFAETYVVPSHQTARSLFTRLPHGMAYADTLIECFATGYLIAVVESICIREMQQHIDPLVEVVVGRDIRIEHRGPIPPGATVRVMGWCGQLGRRSATFCIRAFDDHELVCDGAITLVAADRKSIEATVATKVATLRSGAGGRNPAIAGALPVHGPE
jgi:fluoroacetyl-CoA thioesterase